MSYEPVVAEGKRNVLEVRQMLVRDLTGMFEKVYFVVDRDFDDLQGEEPSESLFCTDRYAIENYLVEQGVVDNILCDNFHCHGDREQRRLIVAGFVSSLQDFNNLCKDVNERLFYARRLGIRLVSGVPEMSPHIRVQLSACTAATGKTCKEILPLVREPLPEEIAGLAEEFAAFQPQLRYRGKFLMEFFKKWLRLLAEDSSANSGQLFRQPVRPNVDSNVLSIGTFALHSPIPEGMREFVQRLV